MKTGRSIWRILTVLALLILPIVVMMPTLGQSAARAEAAGAAANLPQAISASAGSRSPQQSNPPYEALPPGVITQTVLPNMTQPVAMAFDPAGRLFYTERNTGNVRLYAGGTLQTNPVITFSVTNTIEQGLLGIAIDPNFNTNHFIYVYYTCNCTPLENRVVRFTESNGVGSNPQTIFTSPDDTQCGNHNGGNIHFGLDGKLYIAIGDDGCTPQNAQNVAVPNGKMHRINSDGTIPSDNPVFTQTNALPSLYAMGLRNPFDFAIDPYSPGRIFGSENGPSCDDEMNRIQGGYNYGWRASYPCDDANPSAQYNTIAPLWYVAQGPCCVAPTGIEVYSGSSIPQWTNNVFMCAYNTSALYHFVLNGDRTLVASANIVAGVSCNMDVQTGPDGALYYIQGGGYSPGKLIKISGSGTPSPTTTSTAMPTNTAVATNTTMSTSTVAATGTTGSTATRTPSGTPTRVATSTVAVTGTTVSTATGIATSAPSNTAIASATGLPSSTATTCSIQFQDVSQSNTFYPFVTCLACRGILGGYPCGGVGEPCGSTNNPYFRPGVNVSRGQIAKLVAQAAAISDPAGAQVYEDVLPGSPFYTWINQLSNKSYMGGYTCGGPDEPCVLPDNRPYFRPSANATRGQLSKIVSNAAMFSEDASGQTYQDVAPGSTFHIWIERLSSRNVMGGYPCGADGEPCVLPDNRPYFRPNNPVTRGQAAKIVSNTFFPNCQNLTPAPTATAAPPTSTATTAPPTSTFTAVPPTATSVPPTSTSVPPTSTTVPPTATATNTPITADVEMRDFSFRPDQITVTVGSTVRWTNFDLDYHTVTSAQGEPVVLNSPHIQQGESYTHTFNTPGTYNYYCIPHSYMTGSVVVTP